MAGLHGNVPWKRFWIPRETAPALGWDGYLVDPEDGYGKVANAHARTLEQLEDTPCVALLGEPGIGKSRVIDAYSAGLLAGAGAEAVLSIDFRLHRDLETEIFETVPFKQWLAGRSAFGARQKGPTCAREKGPTPRSQFSLDATDA